MKKFSRLFDSCQLLTARILATDSSHQLKISTRCLNYTLLAAGLALLTAGMNDDLFALRTTQYNDQRLVEAINAVLSYLEGSFGALVMVCSGVGAILSAAFGQYRASLGLLVVAIGSFILRSLISTFFNDVGIQE